MMTIQRLNPRRRWSHTSTLFDNLPGRAPASAAGFHEAGFEFDHHSKTCPVSVLFISTGTFYQDLRPGCDTLMMIMISGHDGSQHPAPPSHQLARHQALLTDPQVAASFDILIIMIILQFGLSSSCDSP